MVHLILLLCINLPSAFLSQLGPSALTNLRNHPMPEIPSDPVWKENMLKAPLMVLRDLRSLLVSWLNWLMISWILHTVGFVEWFWGVSFLATRFPFQRGLPSWPLKLREMSMARPVGVIRLTAVWFFRGSTSSGQPKRAWPILWGAGSTGSVSDDFGWFNTGGGFGFYTYTIYMYIFIHNYTYIYIFPPWNEQFTPESIDGWKVRCWFYTRLLAMQNRPNRRLIGSGSIMQQVLKVRFLFRRPPQKWDAEVVFCFGSLIWV